ncbi:hypothetical protein ACJX0J_011253 [Zea mays]
MLYCCACALFLCLFSFGFDPVSPAVNNGIIEISLMPYDKALRIFIYVIVFVFISLERCNKAFALQEERIKLDKEKGQNNCSIMKINFLTEDFCAYRFYIVSPFSLSEEGQATDNELILLD